MLPYLMQLKTTRVLSLVGTETTLKRLLPGMGAHVLLEVVVERRPIGAMRARVALLGRVGEHVPVEGTAEVGAVAAEVATKEVFPFLQV